MKRILLGALPFLCIFLVMAFIYKAQPIQDLRKHSVRIQNGLLTLPKHSAKDVFSIKGLWHFTPSQFYCFRNSAHPQYAPLPGKLNESSLHSAYGYASYGLRIVGMEPSKIYALQIKHILSSCTVIVNGVDRAGQGQPGTSLKTETPGKTSSLVTFKPSKDGTADIIINISNFHNRYGGTDQPILLGSAETLNRLFTFDLLFYNLACTILGVFSIFFIMLYLNYRHMPYILWFATAAFILSLRIMFFYPHIIIYYIPSIPWKLYFSVRYATIPLSTLLFTIFIKHILEVQYPIFYRSLIISCIAASLFIFVAPTPVAAHYLSIQQAIMLAASLYNIAVILHALIQKRPYTLWIASIVALLVVFTVHDILISQWIISGKYLLQEGAIVAILIIVVMNINTYASSIHSIEMLAAEQKDIQTALRRFFPNQLLFFLQKNNITEVNAGDASDRAMTVLSIDIRSFTSMSEQMQPDEVFILLNRYFALVAPIIRKYGGVITKFLGDGFTALFSGCPPDAAVLCGIEIQQNLQRQKIRIGTMLPIRAGIGIDSGSVLLGVIGNDDRLDSMLISKTYYTAESLQAATKLYASTLIISETIFRSLKNPKDYHIRRIPNAAGDNGDTTILYEIYDGDEPSIKDKKTQSNIYMERACANILAHHYSDAQPDITRSLEIFPDDRLAAYYQTLVTTNNN